jgi:hypothetical protein
MVLVVVVDVKQTYDPVLLAETLGSTIQHPLHSESLILR